MTRAVVTAAPSDTVPEIAKKLSQRGISAVPVCNADNELVGIVSEGDLLRPFGQTHHLRRDWWLSILAEGTELAPEFLDYIRQDRRTASDLMTTSVHTTTEGTSIEEAAEIMTQSKVKRLPVMRNEKLVGIISRADLVRAFLGPKPPLRGTADLPASVGAD